MITSQPLRLYASPVKVFLLLLGSVAFVWIGLFLLHDPKVRANPSNTAKVFAAVVFFGFGAVIFLIMTLRYVVFRRPVLQIDAQGWSHKSPLWGEAQSITWQNIRAAAVFRQRMPRTTMYYLVVYARDPQEQLHTQGRIFATSFYPSLSGAAMSVPLNNVFVRTTPAKCNRLLERIVSSWAGEIQLHRVQVSSEMHDL